MVLLIFSSQSNIIADDDDDDDVFDIELRGDEIEVEYEYEIEENGIEYEVEYEVKIKTHFGAGLSVEIKYNEEEESEFFEIESEFKMEAEYISISEYTDVNSNDKYDEGDIMEQTIYFMQLDFNVFIFEEIFDPHGYKITALGYMDLFEFGIVAYIYEAGGNDITRNEVKIDIIINNFSFINDGKILLITEIKSYEEEDGLEDVDEDVTDDDEHDEKVEVHHPMGLGQYIINKEVTIDGAETTVNVYALPPLGEIEAMFVYTSYPNGDTIYHDPTFGLTPSTAPPPVNNNDDGGNNNNYIESVSETANFPVFFSLLAIPIILNRCKNLSYK